MKKTFRELLEAYKQGPLTAEEAKTLASLLQSEEHSPELEEAIAADWEGLADLVDPETHELIYRNIQLAKERPAPVVRLSRWKWVAAAVLVLAIGSWWWVESRRQGAEEGAPVAQQIDIAPGTNGAVLTLADGSTVVLDSAGNGLIASQGNTSIVKLADGQLAYRAAGKETAVLYNQLTTDRGKQFFVKLPDGTGVWLNAGSSLRYPTAFAGKDRRVEITGEAYFEVARDPAKPFVVSSQGQEITVLGTHFNVNAYEDEATIRTTLLEGSVRVEAGGQSRVIRPGEQSVLRDGEIAVRDVNVGDAVAWKNGFFSFRETDIRGIVRQLARWYDVEVRYEGVNPTRTFTGKIDRNLSLAQVLKVLEQTDVHFRIEEGRRLVILP